MPGLRRAFGVTGGIAGMASSTAGVSAGTSPETSAAAITLSTWLTVMKFRLCRIFLYYLVDYVINV